MNLSDFSYYERKAPHRAGLQAKLGRAECRYDASDPSSGARFEAILEYLNADRVLRWQHGLEYLLVRKVVSVVRGKKACPNHREVQESRLRWDEARHGGRLAT